MIDLIYNNDWISVTGDLNKDYIDLIHEGCSYDVPGAVWSEKYQLGVWDGKISLFNKKFKKFPAGLLNHISNLLNENNIQYNIIDQRKKPIITKNAIVDLGKHTFRDYQVDSINVFKNKERGILALCTAAGKTKVSCGIISELSVYPVIFVVPSVSLLKQTVLEFTQSLKPLNDNFKIGKLGGGEFLISEHGVNVATYHTLLSAFNKKYSEKTNKIEDIIMENFDDEIKLLQIDLENSPVSKIKSIKEKIKKIENKQQSHITQSQNKKVIKDLIEKCQLLIIDETHIAAEVIEEISLMSKKAYYKCGLSATPIRLDNKDKRMFGATGPVIKTVTSSELIAKDFLVRPSIYSINLNFLDKTKKTWRETYKFAIVENKQRNELIRDISTLMYSQGRPTLILIERIEHGRILEKMINNSVFVPGGNGDDDSPVTDEEMDYRRYQLNRVENNEIIMIATSWAYTGLDAPKISCLILGCSVSSPVTTIQQIGRVLRKAEGKSDCVIIDFKMKEKYLKDHYNSRKEAFISEEEFIYKIIKTKNDKFVI